MNQKNLNRGLRPTGRVLMLFMLALFFILFVITGVSFAMIAHTGTIRDQDLLDIALHAQLGSGTVQSRRGTIRTSNGVVIAAQHPSYTLFANMHPDWGRVGFVEDIDYTAYRLSEVINLTPERIMELLSQENRWEILFGFAGQNLSFIEYNQIREMNLPGIDFHRGLTRFNPLGTFASHTVGYTRFGNPEEHEGERVGEVIGAMGLESYFNGILTGTDGRFYFRRDSFGFRQPGEERRYVIYPEDGYDIKLTINSNIQLFLERAMDEVLLEANPESIVAVLMNARTGEILAAGSRPTFDPNERNPESYQNAIIYPVEPGSTIKVFTYAAAINDGNYHGDQVFMSGSRAVGGQTVRDVWQGWGEMTFDEGFYRSANTAVIDMFREDWLTFPRWIDYLDAFGFGGRTGLQLPVEHPGRIPSTGLNRLDLYVSGFGQGPITVTPIQMLQATTAILNDGEMVRPQLVAEIYNPNTNTVVQQFEREVVGNPITAETARQMRELMIGVVESEIGTGRNHYVLADVRSGGKTGTAQTIDSETGRYSDDIHIFSYVGFAPAEDPEIVMFVAAKMQTEPNTTGHPYVGEIYRFVMNHTLSYLGLASTRGMYSQGEGNITLSQFDRIKTPSVLNLSRDAAVARVYELGLIPVVIGNGPDVFGQSPLPDTLIVEGDRIFIQTCVEDYLQDFTGWTRTQIFRYANLLGLQIEVSGQGQGARQTTRAGRLVRQGDSLSVTLE